MPVLVSVFQPSVNEIFPSLKVQPGEWLIHSGKVHASRFRDHFAEDDARFLAIALGKQAVFLVFDLEAGKHFVSQFPKSTCWIKRFDYLNWSKVAWKNDFI